MMDRQVALEALCVLCNANVTSLQRAGGGATPRCSGGAATLSIKQLIPAILDGDQFWNKDLTLDCEALRNISCEACDVVTISRTRPIQFVDEDDLFDPRFDYDFSNLKDTEVYYRGGEVYERPCGWYRFAIKVLNKYDENAWLGTRYRSTESVPGEWPVSFHGTSDNGAQGIISDHYKPGPGQVYGRGIYSTPFISEADKYAKTFKSPTTGKKYKVVLQNRINPQYREKHNYDKYYLVRIPKGTSDEDEQKMVERAIRPYGLLLKEV
ncbi:uncharacterized protein [Pempheris klunzingeri]|uniref:uncharacterized protein n=1 Tax=Pempheris klunzingeri TaxID=3127111 RepID=UPI00397E9824